MPTVSLAAADAPFALALDLGTSSLRALPFDRQGRAIEGGEEQLVHTLRTTAGGGAEADADHLFDLLVRCVDGALARLGQRAGDVVAVGADCFWHGLLGLDGQGAPATPIYMWADTRSRDEADALRRAQDVAAVHARTGAVPHSLYWPAKLRWLRAAEPDTAARVARWCSFAEYADLRLHGEARVTFSMASGTGLLDVHRLTWDEEQLAAAGIGTGALMPLGDRDEPYSRLTPEFAARWPALASVPWYPALGDGACANVGSGAVAPGRLALTVGTSGALRLVTPAAPASLPLGLWSYRLDRRRYVLGGALSNGGNLLAWLGDLLHVAHGSAALTAAGELPPDAHGLTFLPFVAGERAPSWNDRATATIAGLTIHTRPEHLLRAAMEAVAYRFALIDDVLRPLAAPSHEIVANGGAILHSPVWLQIMADTLDHALIALPPGEEASARGAALLALEAAGAIPDPAAAPDPAAGATVYHSDPERHARYRAGLDRQTRLEATLASFNAGAEGRSSLALR